MIRYRLDDLGWFQFEWLCQSLLKAELGLGVEAWGGSGDFGRDAFSKGPHNFPNKSVLSEGPFVFQAKFVSEANNPGANPDSNIINAVSSEIRQIKKRIIANTFQTPSHYIFLTNAPLSSKLRSDIESRFKTELPRTQITTLGSSDICDLLDINPALRTAFPQILGLRDLTDLINNVLNKSVVERSLASVSLCEELSKVFVPTNAHSKALRLLNEHNFAVITGPPEMGKTAIARMIGFSKIGEEWEYIECRTPEDFFRAYSSSKRQIYVVDDAFGSTEYRADLGAIWESDLEKVLTRIDRIHWLIWTSRPAPLALALSKINLQGKAEKFPEPSKVVVEAKDLTVTEKALILYRHCKNAKSTKSEKELVKTHAKALVSDDHFTPERIRRFINNDLSKLAVEGMPTHKQIGAIELAVKQAISTPTVQMSKSFDALEETYKAFLISLLDTKPGPILEEYAYELYARHNSTSLKTLSHKDIEVLKEHFLKGLTIVDRRNSADGILHQKKGLDWLHPSWRDLVIDHLKSNKVARNLFLKSCGLDGIRLALSIGGGLGGERVFPLLISESDWEALQSNIVFKISANHNERSQILGILKSTFTTSEIQYSAFRKDHLIQMNSEVLNALLNSWNEENKDIPTQDLELYSQLSLYVIPLPAAPDLSSTWRNSCTQVQSLIDNNFDADEMWRYSIENWIDLKKVIELLEPRLLLLPNNNVKTEELENHISNSIENYIDQIDKDNYDYAEQFEKEKDHLDCLYRIAFDSELSVNLMEEKITIMQEDLDNWKSDRFPEPDYDDRDYSISHSEREPTMEDIFSDL